MPKYNCKKTTNIFSQKIESPPEQISENIVQEIKDFDLQTNTNISNIIIDSDNDITNQTHTNQINRYRKYEKSKTYMASYLESLRNKDGKFKRKCISPLRYAGGKSKAIGLILDNLPLLINKKIVSPFFGGGSLELCLSQELDIEVIGYDIYLECL